MATKINPTDINTLLALLSEERRPFPPLPEGPPPLLGANSPPPAPALPSSIERSDTMQGLLDRINRFDDLSDSGMYTPTLQSPETSNFNPIYEVVPKGEESTPFSDYLMSGVDSISRFLSQTQDERNTEKVKNSRSNKDTQQERGLGPALKDAFLGGFAKGWNDNKVGSDATDDVARGIQSLWSKFSSDSDSEQPKTGKQGRTPAAGKDGSSKLGGIRVPKKPKSAGMKAMEKELGISSKANPDKKEFSLMDALFETEQGRRTMRDFGLGLASSNTGNFMKDLTNASVAGAQGMDAVKAAQAGAASKAADREVEMEKIAQKDRSSRLAAQVEQFKLAQDVQEMHAGLAEAAYKEAMNMVTGGVAPVSIEQQDEVNKLAQKFYQGMLQSITGKTANTPSNVRKITSITGRS